MKNCGKGGKGHVAYVLNFGTPYIWTAEDTNFKFCI